MCLEIQLLWVRGRKSLLRAFPSLSGLVWWCCLACYLPVSQVSAHSFSSIFLSLPALLPLGSPALHAPALHHSWNISEDGLNLLYLLTLDFRLTVPSPVSTFPSITLVLASQGSSLCYYSVTAYGPLSMPLSPSAYPPACSRRVEHVYFLSKPSTVPISLISSYFWVR